MKRITSWLVMVWLVAPAAAGAQDGTPAVGTGTPDASAAAQEGLFLPHTLTPRIGSTPAFVTVSSGFDGGRHAAVFESAAELRLGDRVAVRAGATYTADAADPLRPTFGARVQLLDQRRHGVDGAAGVYFRPVGAPGATWEDGALAVVLALGRQDGRVGSFLNLTYEQDPEGDDFAAEIRSAIQVRALRWLDAGVDGRARFDLGSDDPRRPLGAPDLEVAGGPFATVTLGRFALSAHTGVAAVERAQMQVGALALGALAAIF